MLLLVFVACASLSASNAVTSGASDPIWDPETLPIVRLTFDQSDWEAALESEITDDDCAERPYLPAEMAYDNPVTGATETVGSVGVRYRGHSALKVPNKSAGNRWGFKIAFDEYTDDARFHDMKKLVLLGTEGDYSLLRERVGQAHMRDAGVPAPRANHMRLYINGEYQGVFPHVEEVDDTAYLDAHFGESDGSLYKVAGYCAGTHLDFEGDDPTAYAGFEPKAHTDEEDKATDLVPLFDCLMPGVSDDAFRTCVEAKIDVDEWLTEMAIDALMPNIDGMESTAQNFLLYRPTDTGKFVVYPYDLDLSFFGASEDFASTSIFSLRPVWEDELPVLPARLRAAYASRYCTRVLEVAQAFAPEAIEAELSGLETFLGPDMRQDPFVEYEGWTASIDEVVAVATARHAVAVAEAQACEVPWAGK